MQKKVEQKNIVEQDALDICKKVNLNLLKNKTVVISGASGLLGTYFLESIRKFIELTNSKIKVVGIIHSKVPDHLKGIERDKSFNILRGDLSSSSFLKKIPRADVIIHCAGYAQPGRFLEDKIKTLKLNTLATFSLLEKLKNNGKFLFISTSELYSGLKNPPYKESQIGCTNTNHPRACYIEGKRCGEAICLSYRSKGYDVKCARLSLAYGPGNKKDDQRVLYSLIQKGLLEKKISLLDQGKAMRTYCYISDIIEIMWNIIFFGKEPVYNVGGVSRLKIRDLAKKIGKALNVPVNIPIDDSSLIGAPKEVSLDLSKIRNEFKKKEFIDIDEGLKRTIDWQIKIISNRS